MHLIEFQRCSWRGNKASTLTCNFWDSWSILLSLLKSVTALIFPDLSICPHRLFSSQTSLCRALNYIFVAWRVTDWGARRVWGDHLHPLYKWTVSGLLDRGRSQPSAFVASKRERPNASATETRPPMFNGSWTSRGNHLGGYPVPCGWAVPSASGFRGKDHVPHTQPEPSGVNKMIRSSSPKCFGFTHENFRNGGTMEYLQAPGLREVSSHLTE